ncbi:MAG TPA: Z1 domain-containing protein [Gemmatimonadaceae bacterium]|nr:Z1 domain-containing protein [Gemmatimonadaceae bacterium]
MNENYKAVRAAAQMLLNQQHGQQSRSLESEEIRSAVLRTATLFGCADIDLDAIVADLEACFQTRIGAERVLTGADEKYAPWLNKRKAAIDWKFWTRYEQYLLREKSWPQATLDRLDETTDKILGLLTDPEQSGSWDRRGMVVGHVQSGKTANYIGLIAKAADAGYKLIVVLAGFHKSLRSQTQIRLEEGFLGYDRGATAVADGMPAAPIGVGLIDPLPRANSITARADDGDFKRQVANTFAINPGGLPLLFVVKKNGPVLKNLLQWVRWAANASDERGRRYVKDVPLLVIDDEADQGSIDTKQGAINEDGTPDPDHDPTQLNRRIRELLHLFDQSAYVGYTATPFANIFIHEQGRTEQEGEDLFPRSFIVSLPAPSNYVGPAEVFGYENDAGESVPGLPIIRLVDDYAVSDDPGETEGWMPPKHKIDHVPRYYGSETLPPSLIQAIRTFILSCAARLARGQATDHNSMLVHVTRFTAVQQRVAEQIRKELLQVQRRLRYGDGDSSDQLLEELRELWENDFEPTSNEIDERYAGYRSFPNCWVDIEPFVEQAALSISVREINGQAGEVLDYVNHEGTGLNVIAVGGDKLSRGLTLEGLTVSYFLRASRMYDTLMQMGRWFGYRPGYLDLCRLYTTPELAEWYSHIAAASDELREDFNRMAASGATPREFGHRVRSHPLMMVTSQVKMRHGASIDITFDGDISETINFWRTRNRLEPNWRAAQRMIADIEASGKFPRPAPRPDGEWDRDRVGAWIWEDVSEQVVIDFLTSYKEHDASRRVKTKLLADYIRAEAGQGRLTTWSVMLANGSGSIGTLGSARFRHAERSWYLTGGDDESRAAEKESLKQQNHFRIRRLVNPTDEPQDLNDEECARAMRSTRDDWEKDPLGRAEPSRPAGPQIRRERPPTRGLLILYPLEPGGDGIKGSEKVDPTAADLPLLGFAISFPRVDSAMASRVQYVVNNIYYKQEFESSRIDDEDWT